MSYLFRINLLTASGSSYADDRYWYEAAPLLIMLVTNQLNQAGQSALVCLSVPEVLYSLAAQHHWF